MSDDSTQPSPQEPAFLEAPPAVRWRSWPLREQPGRTLVVAVCLLGAGVVVGWSTGRVHLAILAVAALALALWRFFVPVEFALSHQGVDQRLLGRWRRIAWEAIRHYELCPSGVLLLPDEDHSPISVFRGLYLPFADHRPQVLAHVQFYLDRSQNAS